MYNIHATISQCGLIVQATQTHKPLNYNAAFAYAVNAIQVLTDPAKQQQVQSDALNERMPESYSNSQRLQSIRINRSSLIIDMFDLKI